MEQNQSIVLKKEDFTEQGGNLYMSLRELSKRLGYSKSNKIWTTYKRNEEELQPFSTVLKMGTVDGKGRDVVVLNETGCYVISMLSKTPKAKEFRKQLANLIMNLRKQNLHLVPARTVALLEDQMKGMSARIRRLEAQQAVYYLAEKERLCSRRRWNMSKKQYENIVRMLKKGMASDEIADMLAVPVWIVKKAHEIEVHGGRDFGFRFLTGKTRAEIDEWIDGVSEKMSLLEAGNE